MSENTQENFLYPALAESAQNAIQLAADATPTVIGHGHSDDQLIDLWLHGRSPHTERVYRSDAERFQTFTGLPLARVRLVDLQKFADALEATGNQPATRHRTLAAIKSLFTFAHRLGYLPFDTAKPLRLPKLRDGLSERILDEAEVQRMLALERNPRNSAMLFLLYASGIRVAELCGLRWKDFLERQAGMGQITVLGKGSKTRSILIPSGVKSKLDRLRRAASDDQPIFVSRHKRAISPCQVLRIVKAAAKRADIHKAVSPHWLRHAHCSHALDHGAPIHLVQATAGHASLQTTGSYVHARATESSATYLPI